MGFVFQAGHAISILVTRSTASLLVRRTFAVPQLFEHSDNKTNQAGHVHFKIIAGDASKCLVRQDFMGPVSRVCEVDQAGSVPNSCPILTSFSFEKGRPLRAALCPTERSRARGRRSSQLVSEPGFVAIGTLLQSRSGYLQIRKPAG
jgi:hypothetical protein